MMETHVDSYWKIKLASLQHVLEKNNFDVFMADDAPEAKSLVIDHIIPSLQPRTISWGGSLTFMASGIYNALREIQGITAIDMADPKIDFSEKTIRRKKALGSDLYFTSTNSITEKGQLVNLDMIGNRVAALAFGPKHVIVLVSRNKLTPDIEAAMARIRQFVAPANAIQLDKKTPCVNTGCCEDCCSPERICNTWTIIEKSFPKGRIKIILINADMGL